MSQTYVSAGRTVAAERGWSWIADAWALFKRNPGMWIGIIVVFALLFAAMSVVPLVGPLASVVLAPVFTGGLMLGCRALEERGELTLGHLFAGFRDRFGTLAAVGALYLAATLVIVLIVVLVMGAGVLAMVSGNPAALAAGGVTLLLAVLLAVALSLPAMMAVWFAPALVVFHAQGAMQAMQESFIACLKNMIPFLVYGVIGLLLAVVASIPLGLGWLVLGPVIAASVYTAYRDIFLSS